MSVRVGLSNDWFLEHIVFLVFVFSVSSFMFICSKVFLNYDNFLYSTRHYEEDRLLLEWIVVFGRVVCN